MVVLFAGLIAFVLAGKASNAVSHQLSQPALVSTPVSGDNNPVLQQVPGNAPPTPTGPSYQIGVWPSTSNPGAGPLQIFVRVSHLTAPAPGVPVTLLLQYSGSGAHYGPVKTGPDGLATFNVTYSSGFQPVFVTATATVEGQTISAQTTFVPH